MLMLSSWRSRRQVPLALLQTAKSLRAAFLSLNTCYEQTNPWVFENHEHPAAVCVPVARFTSTRSSVEEHDRISNSKPFDKILVANRGEIACRVMRTAQSLGMRAVAVFSEADADSPHVRMADEAICVGPAASSASYLNIDAILAAVRLTGAQAVHPGYGFLSENAKFVERLEEMGVAFVGPTSSAIAAMGDKIESKQLAMGAGVNTIPGCQDVIRDEDHAVAVAKEVGYPVMLKASAGGGGKGMRIAWNEEDVRNSFCLCRDEAVSSFGDGRIFIERFVEEPRHIEIQVLGDAHGNVIYFPERECSIQRRNQKVVEEAPSVFLDAATRKAMGEQAVQLAQAVQYRSSGTVEFLVDKHRNFYFLEMNTRLQVEHPVTELITKVDLVEEMFRVAAGEQLRLRQEDVQHIDGWAIECRVYAEDPQRGFLPCNGKLRWYTEPTPYKPKYVYKAKDVRVDSGVEEGSDISIYYDPLISKLATKGATREAAIASMERALDTYVIRGLTHNAAFLRSVISHPEFKAGRLTTNFLQQHFPKGWKGATLDPEQKEELAVIAAFIHLRDQYRMSALPVSGRSSPTTAEAYLGKELSVRMDGPEHVPMSVYAVMRQRGPEFSMNAKIGIRRVDLTGGDVQEGYPWVVKVEFGGPYHQEPFYRADPNVTCQILERLPRGFRLQYEGVQLEVIVQAQAQAELEKFMPPPLVVDDTKVLRSPMPGSLISVSVHPGQEVSIGDELAVVEAMKMRNVLRAERSGVVKAILAKPGSTVAVDEVILEFAENSSGKVAPGEKVA